MIGRKRHPVPAPTPRRAPLTRIREVLFVGGPASGRVVSLTSAQLNELDLLDPAEAVPAKLGVKGAELDYRFVSHPTLNELAIAALDRGLAPGTLLGHGLAYYSPGTRLHPVLATVAKLTAWCATCDKVVYSACDGAVGGGVRVIDTWTHAASNLDLVHQPTPAHPITITTHEVRNA